MTKKQTFICCVIGGLISRILLTPIYKKSYEENKKREEELLKKTEDMGRKMVQSMVDESFRRWQEKQQREES